MSITNTPSILYRSKSWTLANLENQPARRFPLPQNCPIQFSAYAFDQKIEMITANFPPAPKNTPSNSVSGGSAVFAGLLDGNAILTRLSNASGTRGGNVASTASFAVVPASWDDIVTQTITFPGWVNNLATGQVRSARSRNVSVRLRYDYFVIDPAGVLTGAGVLDSGGGAINTVFNAGAIPVNLRNVWLNTLGGGFTPQQNSECNDLTPSGGVGIGVLFYTQTYPSVNQYKVWIANAASELATYPWTGAHPVIWDGALSGGNMATAGQYRPADSSLKVYEGNIYERVTPYVIPQ